jgi:protein disulfide-isomerase
VLFNENTFLQTHNFNILTCFLYKSITRGTVLKYQRSTKKYCIGKKEFMMRNKLSFLFLLIFSFSIQLPAQDGRWLEDYEAGLAEAKATGKYLFLNFSGSDWCGWCIKLDEEVLSQKSFLDYAKDHLVLTVLDFPRSKKQSQALQTQNQNLARDFGIMGFPTVVILDSKGKLVAKTGYRRGGAESYVSHIRSLILEYEAKHQS